MSYVFNEQLTASYLWFLLYAAVRTTPSPTSDEDTLQKKPKLSRRSLADALQAKTDAQKEIRLKELELEERRLKLEENRNAHQIQLEQDKMKQQGELEKERLKQQGDLMKLLSSVLPK